MLTLKESMNLAGQNLLATLSPAHNYLPYWRMVFDQQHHAECEMAWPAHNVGRWWDAMLRLEAATGFTIPQRAEEQMLRNLKACLENPLGVCGNLVARPGLASVVEPAGWFDDHSQREILLALTALVRLRESSWAAELGSKMVRALDGYILADGSWDISGMATIARQAGISIDPAIQDEYSLRPPFRHVETHGRLIEALLEFYLAAQDPAALLLAGRLARFHIEVSTRPDGSRPPSEHLHTHSFLGTLRGLLLYGQLTGQQDFVERVAHTYQVTVMRTVRPSGFISHDFGKETDGETGSVGDVVQLALRLAHSGYPQFLDDAERILRARLLPSQVTRSLGIQPTQDDGKDEHLHLDERILGAFGGLHSHPYGGTTPFTDVTSAGLHALCDVYAHVIEETPLGLRVNFQFDFEDPRVLITSIRGETARLSIDLKSPQPLLVRIPGWSPPDSVRLMVDAIIQPPVYIGNFLYIPERATASHVEIEYALPLTNREETINGVTYRLTWKGDDVVGITPNTDWLPFYPTAGI